DKEADREQDKENSDVVDRQERESQNGEEKTDRANDPGCHKTGIGKLEIHEDEPRQSEKQREIRLRNGGEELLTRRHLVVCHALLPGPESTLLARKHVY